MSSYKIADIMEICDCSKSIVMGWINKGYLHAEPMIPGKYRSALVIKEEDLRAFLRSSNYQGHPNDILKSRAFTRTNDLENCYPINLLIDVLQINLDSEEKTPDIWDYDIRAFKSFIGQLNDNEQKVIEMRFHLGMTLDEVAVALGRTRERIRQIQIAAERKLRHWSRGSKIVTKEAHQELLDKYHQLTAEYERLRVQFENISGPAAFETAGEPKVDASHIRLEDMDLTVRSYNCLKRAGIDTLKDVIEFDMNQADEKYRNWLTVRNLGKKSLMEVARKVFEYCRYRIQYCTDGKFQGYIPILEGESLVIGNVEYYGGET